MDYREKAAILRACSSKKGNQCSSCPAFGQGSPNCARNAKKDGAQAITDLMARAEEAEARCETLEKMVKEYQEVIIPGFREQAEKAEKERDNAVRDICEIFGEVESIRLKYGMDDPEADDRLADVCHIYCSNFGPMCFKDGDGHKCENFKWRGVKEE